MGRWISGFVEGTHNFSWERTVFFHSNFQPRASDWNSDTWWTPRPSKAIQPAPGSVASTFPLDGHQIRPGVTCQPGRRAYPPVWCVGSRYFPRHHLMQRSQCHGPSLLKHLGTDHCIPLWLSNGVGVTDCTEPRWVYSAATPVKLQHLLSCNNWLGTKQHVDMHLLMWSNNYPIKGGDHDVGSGELDIYDHHWLVVEPPLWKIWNSIGMIIPNIWKK